jgi:hypothetical protein
MEYTNAFRGKTRQPAEVEVAGALGSTAQLWSDLIRWMAEKEGVAEQEWKGICVKKYGWSLRLKQKKRNIIYLSPGKDCFMASFILSDKALDEAKHAHLPKVVQDALASAPHYPEGNGLRLIVHRTRDLAPVRKIAAIKVAN